MMSTGFGPGIFLIGVGVAGMAISAFADLIGIGRPPFGLEQLSGLVIGAFVIMAGLVRTLSVDTRKLARVLGWIYVAGVFYVGLRPNPLIPNQYKILLRVSGFNWYDITINTLGFILLGYLFMLSFGIRRIDRRDGTLVRRAITVAITGGLISLFLEVSQYYLILGRDSNLMDLIANTLGILLGIGLYLVDDFVSERMRVKHV